MIGSLLKELAVTAGTAAVKAIVKLVRRKSRDEWVDVPVSQPPQPLSHKDVAHQQAQIRSATTGANRNASTVRPGKPGKLPR